MLGAGKGTVADYLHKNKNFVYLSVRNFVAAEVLRRGKLVSRETISQAASQMKGANGEEYIVKELLSQALLEKKYNVVIESIRTKAEAEYLKAHGVKLWAIHTDVAVRYARTMESKKDADKIPLEQFLANEKKEFAATQGSEEMLLEAMKIADVTISNNGSKEDLFAQVDARVLQTLTETIQ